MKPLSAVIRCLLASALLTMYLVGLTGCESNSAPTVRSLGSQEECITALTRCRVIAIASDPDEDTLTYSWEASAGTLTGSGPVVTWRSPGESGNYTITVVVRDGRGGEATEQLTIDVSKKPIIENLSATPSRVDTGGVSRIECKASDPEGDALTYSWSASAGSISGDGPRVEWTPPTEGGRFIIRVSVTDSSCGETTKHMTVEANRPPIVQNLKTGRPQGGACTVRPGTGNTVKCVAIDPDGDQLMYDWSASGGKFSGSGRTSCGQLQIMQLSTRSRSWYRMAEAVG